MALLLCLNRVLNAVSSSSPSSVRRSRLGRQGQHGAGANGGGGFEQGRKKRAKTNPNSVRFIKHKCKKKKEKEKNKFKEKQNTGIQTWGRGRAYLPGELPLGNWGDIFYMRNKRNLKGKL